MTDEVFDQEVTPASIDAGTDSTTTRHTFEVIAVETMHRKYTVEADSQEQAEARLRRYFADPIIIQPGIVTPVGEGERHKWLIRGKAAKSEKKG